MRVKPKYFYLMGPWLFCACISFERSHDSGYAQGSDHATESGWQKVATKSEDHRPPMEQTPSDEKQLLKQLENRISAGRELEQYSRALPWFENEGEKIQFLQVSGYEARQNWLNSQNFGGRAKKIATQMQEIVDSQDIALGMPENLVKKSWGEPKEIAVSGVPQFHNQRWIYQKFISSQEGYKSEKKMVYFEGGRVVGWETQ